MCVCVRVYVTFSLTQLNIQKHVCALFTKRAQEGTVCCVKSKGGIERAVLQEGTHCRLKRRATSQIMLTAFLSVLRPQVQPPDNIHGSNKQQRANKHEVNAVERPLHAYMQRKSACAYIYRHAPIQTYIHAFIQAWGMCRHKVLHRASAQKEQERWPASATG